ncbi:MAG: hypothetical protein J6D25_05565 [Eggerthellaceae bacterium]|nr:hypothetical protein [Eggerthellaceae bacterium]
MPPKSVLLKIALFAGLGTGLVCLVDGLIWDFAPFNKYQGMFWLTFMPLILFFMKEQQERKYLVNMWLSFVCGLIWGLIAIGAIMLIMPTGGPVVLDIVIDFLICALIAFVHKGLLDQTPFNAVACVFLGFAETLGCMQTSFPIAGQLVPPMTLNGIDLIIIFTWGLLVTFCLSFVCDKLIGKFVLSKLPAPADNSQETIEQQ